MVVGDFTDDESTLAWITSNELTLARRAGDHSAAADLAAATVEHLRAAAGIEDDFFVLWPPLVLTALAAGDLDLADRLLEPVATAQPGLVSPGVGAQWLRLRGLVGAARGADPSVVEADLRAGIEALGAFGAVGERARAQEELARWLVEQDRAADAAPLVVSARETYAEIGADGMARPARRLAGRPAVGHPAGPCRRALVTGSAGARRRR